MGGRAVADELAFEPFVRTHATQLLRAAVLLTGSRDRGEELLQATLTHLYPRWHQVAHADAPLAYARRALVNRFVSEQRSPRRNVVPVWDVPDLPDGPDLGDTLATRHAVWHLLEQLPERARAAVVLRYFYDLPDAEIADTLGCRAATVRSILSRALAVLRRELAGDGLDMRAGS